MEKAPTPLSMKKMRAGNAAKYNKRRFCIFAQCSLLKRRRENMAEFKLEMKGICKSFPGVKGVGQRTAVAPPGNRACTDG